jgi:hypothetical protein
MLAASMMCFTILIIHGTFFKYLLYKNFIFVSLILPTMVLLVTKVIATNLYLSLGMIGALSIVRYRTPVKSQYELALYFTFICIGIIIGVKLNYALYAFLFMIAVPLFYKLVTKVFAKFNFYKPLNTENNNISMNIFLENKESERILNEKGIISKLKNIEINNDMNQTLLNMVFEDMNEAIEFKNEILNKFEIKSVNISNS